MSQMLAHIISYFHQFQHRETCKVTVSIITCFLLFLSGHKECQGHTDQKHEILILAVESAQWCHVS